MPRLFTHTLFAFALACALFLFPAGCGEEIWSLGAAPNEPLETKPPPVLSSVDETHSAPGPDQRRVVALQVSFDILQVRALMGVFSQSGKIWNHLEEEVIPVETAKALRRNGLRVARGTDSSWPPIRALLEQEKTAESFRSRMIVANGLPLVMELDDQPVDQTLFLFRSDGTLGGATFPMSTNVLRLEYEVLLMEEDSIEVTVVPEIRLPQPPSQMVGDMGGFVVKPAPQPSRVLRELAYSMKIGRDDFLVIGPSEGVRQRHLAGSLLLCDERDGRWFETVYFVTPRIVNISRDVFP